MLQKYNLYICFHSFYVNPFSGATGACVDSCEVGYYASDPQCLACDANCLDCADASNLCTACKAPSFLQVRHTSVVKYFFVSCSKCEI